MMITEVFDRKLVPHDKKILNQKIFDGIKMRPEVRIKLLQNAIEFFKSLGVDLKIIDVVLTGSNAQYVYSNTSDADVHIICDLESTGFADIARKYLDSARSLWGVRHKITLRGHPVEPYVEDVNDTPPSAIYSIVNDKWVREPTHDIPEDATPEVIDRVSEFAGWLLDNIGDPEETREALSKLYGLRSAGLRADGEASVDNLAFKSLRNSGAIDMLWKQVYNYDDSQLSLPEELERRNGIDGKIL